MERTLLLLRPLPLKGKQRERKIKHRLWAGTRTQHAGKHTTSLRQGFEMRNLVLGQGDGESVRPVFGEGVLVHGKV